LVTVRTGHLGTIAKPWRIGSIILALFVVAGWHIYPWLRYPEDTPLIRAFEHGKQSPELFELPNGVNEFDLLLINGVYYFAQDDKTTTQLRSAKSVGDLATATPYMPVPHGRFPSIQYENGVWHLWLWFGDQAVTRHFKSANFAGPYAATDTLPVNLADIHVRKAPNGQYYAAYKDLREGAQLASGLLTARSPDGPWDDLGHIFTDGRDSWHVGEEADPAFFDVNGKSYIAFAGWDGADPNQNQKLGLVEIDLKSGKAIGKAIVLLEAEKPWHIKNNQRKLFNPVFLCDRFRSRMFFAQNVSGSGTPAGWGYIEANNSCRN